MDRLTRDHMAALDEAISRCAEDDWDEIHEGLLRQVRDAVAADLDMREGADELPSPEEIDDMARVAGLDGDPFKGD